MPQTAVTNSINQYLERLNGVVSLALTRADFRVFVEQADDLLSDKTNWNDNCLPPTHRAMEATLSLLAAAANGTVLPEGDLYADGDGGLRVEWRAGTRGSGKERYVVLATHACEEREDYLYFQQGSVQGELLTETTRTQLAHRLKWLVTVRKSYYD